jgi:predicted acylesterase/phospholipase RssA
LLQGGGVLGAYKAGIYEALVEDNLRPDWVVGISIGGINGAITAGNPREARVARLRELWELVMILRALRAIARGIPSLQMAPGVSVVRECSGQWSAVFFPTKIRSGA